MKKHTKCHMNEICKIPHRDGECEKNCYYNTIEVKTNADCIRSMSDEELAAFCGKDVDACPPGHDSDKCIDELYVHGERPYPSDKQCIECWLNWLKQEGE